MRKESFSSRAKAEAAEFIPEPDCCKIAEMSAIMHTAGSLIISRGALSVEFSEQAHILEPLSQIISVLYGCALEIRGKGFAVPATHAAQILTDCGILKAEGGGGHSIVRGVDAYVIQEDCCRAAYLKGAFLGGGYVKISSGASTGYHLEFNFAGMDLASDFSHLLAGFGFFPRAVTRKGRRVVYLKESAAISDFLALIGAPKAVITLNEEAALKDFRNNINRGTNCITANLGRAAETGVRQAEAIKAYAEKEGLSSLPPKLLELAVLRIEASGNADYGYFAEQLGITKSGVKHRFEKIMEIIKNSTGES